MPWRPEPIKGRQVRLIVYRRTPKSNAAGLERVIGTVAVHRLSISVAQRIDTGGILMRRCARGLVLKVLGTTLAVSMAVGSALAQDVPQPPAPVPAPVVVELFTSQGCAACPPADAFLAELSRDPAVLPLALHVDYWDYIGWSDRFAKAAFTARQKAYAHAAGQRMIYTPQMIVAGRIEIAGTKPRHVRAAIAAEQNRSAVMRIDLAAQADGGVRVRLTPLAPIEPSTEVIVVRYAPLRETEITRGENAGHTFHYVNVVTDWAVLGTWDGQAPAEFDIPAPSEPQPGAVLVQAVDKGPILSAARLD